MTDVSDIPPDAGGRPASPNRDKMTYQQVVETLLSRSDEDRERNTEQHTMLRQHLETQSRRHAQLIAYQQKNHEEDRRHQRETLDRIEQIVVTAVSHTAAQAAAPVPPTPPESEPAAAASAAASTERPDAEDPAPTASRPGDEDGTAPRKSPETETDDVERPAGDETPDTTPGDSAGGGTGEDDTENPDARTELDPEPAVAEEVADEATDPATRDGGTAAAEPDAPTPAQDRIPPTEEEDQTGADNGEQELAADEVTDSDGEREDADPDHPAVLATRELLQETLVPPLRAIEKQLIALEEAQPAAGASKEASAIIEVLGLIRETTDKHTDWITSLMARLPEPAPPPSAEPAKEMDPGEKAFLQVMGRLDAIVNMVNGAGTTAAETEDEASKEPEKPPAVDAEAIVAATADLSRQLRTERGHFIRFAWIGGILAVLALPLVLVLGILLQQQFSPLAMPDPTIGWKDRVWDSAGQDVARCLSREDEGGAACVITVIPPLD